MRNAKLRYGSTSHKGLKYAHQVDEVFNGHLVPPPLRYSGLLSGMMISTASLVAVTGPPLVSALTPTVRYASPLFPIIMVTSILCSLES